MSTIAGLLELHLDRPLEAALSFAQHYATVGDPTAFGVQLAVACLEQSGQAVPGWMAQTAERGCATEEERKRVEEVIQGLLLREGVPRDVARASELPPAPPATSEQPHPTDELGALITAIQHRSAELRHHLARGELAKVAPLATEIRAPPRLVRLRPRRVSCAGVGCCARLLDTTHARRCPRVRRRRRCLARAG